MEKCPKCNKYSVAYDAYRKVHRCMIDGCSCVVIDDKTYSYLKADSSDNTINEIKVEEGKETGILKKYSLA